MSSETTPYDIFISYARKDNEPVEHSTTQGWVTAIRDHILADHRRFSTEPLRIFFDLDEIKDMDDWRLRILGGLRSSKILLVCLSPNYFNSNACRWEWQEYITHQVHRLMGSDSIAGVYFVEVPGSRSSAAEFSRWVQEMQPLFDDITRANYTDLRPWFPEGSQALQKEEVRRRLAALGESLWERLQRARRAEAAPGNLRRQTPFFVGRREELRRLHEQLGTGAVGVVTAVHGLGGQGKTELAVAYAHAWADCYPAGLWALEAEGRTELLPLIGELAFKSEFADDAALPFVVSEELKSNPTELGRAVLLHLKKRADAIKEIDPDKGAAALLLLDNVSEPALLSPGQLAGLPRTDWLRLIATTRLAVKPLKDNLVAVAVDSLDEESALTLLRDHQPPRDAQGEIVLDPAAGTPRFVSAQQEEAARQIVRSLGGFTLAVEQAAVFLGLHPDVLPSAFLAGMRQQGIPELDKLAADADVAAQMLTQSKQLGAILQVTLARLDPAAVTALTFAALLPPDSVPWPWLRALTLERHPQAAEKDAFGADPWLKIKRQLSGLRLLTAGDRPEIARIHRLVAAHFGEGKETLSSDLQKKLNDYLFNTRASAIYQAEKAPENWELDALLAAWPHRLDAAEKSSPADFRDIAYTAVYFSDILRRYRPITAEAALIKTPHVVLERFAAADPQNSRWQWDLSSSHERIGDVFFAQGDLPRALGAYQASLAIRKKLAAAGPQNSSWQNALSVSYNKVGDVIRTQGDFSRSLDAYRASLVIKEKLAAADPHDSSWQDGLSDSYARLGDLIFLAHGDLSRALSAYQASLAIQEKLAAANPQIGRQHSLSVSYYKVGDVFLRKGDLSQAMVNYQASQTYAEELAAACPQDNTWQRYLSISYEKLGDVFIAQSDLLRALSAYQASLAIQEKLAAADPQNKDWQRDRSISYSKVGDVFRAQGDLVRALRSFEDSLAIREKLAAADPQNGEWQRDLAVSYYKLANFAEQTHAGEAAGFWKKCLAVLRTMRGHNMFLDPPIANLLQQLEARFKK